MNYGATITSITVPDNNGKPVSLASGFDKFEEYFSEEYRANSPYFGCTVGRYCSQIKDAKFILNEKEYNLSSNCGLNNLHGGREGFDKKIWNTLPYEKPNEVGIMFSTISENLEEGFPGKVNVNILIKLTNNNEIVFDYSASTDAATPLSMTNHTYFNLSGFTRNVEDFNFQVNTNKLLELDETGAATGKVKNVSGSMEDLQQGRSVKSVHNAIGGFEHFYVFNNLKNELIPVATVSDNESGRKF